MNSKTNKLLRNISIFALMLIVTTGCKSTTTKDDNDSSITLRAQIASQNENSKVANEAFEDGDKISLFAVKYTGEFPGVLGNNKETYIKNQLCKYNSDYFIPYDATDLETDIYYPSDGSLADIYALYPYTETISNYSALPVKVASIQTEANWYNSDYMMSLVNKVEQTPNPQLLLFHHLLAKVTINVVLNNFASGVTVEKVTFRNMYVDATLDISAFDGSSAPTTLGTSREIVSPQVLATPTSGFAYTAQAILPQQTLSLGATVAEIQIDNQNKDTYYLSISNEIILASDKNHSLNVTVDAGGSRELTTEAAITPWNENSYIVPESSQIPEYKFMAVLINSTGKGLDLTKNIKAGVNGNRTFLVNNVKYLAASPVTGFENYPAISFEFFTDGNSPAEVPFTISSLSFLNVSNSQIANALTGQNKVEITQKSEDANVIYVDVNNTPGVITPTYVIR